MTIDTNTILSVSEANQNFSRATRIAGAKGKVAVLRIIVRGDVSAMEKAHSEQALSASWARAKADWYDLVIAKEDDLLDRWEHEKNQENKGPRRKGYRW